MQTVSLDVEFDGDINTLVDAIRRGLAFSYDGRPLPIPNVIIQGSLVIVIFAHRPLIIDLSDALSLLAHRRSVRLQMRFSR